MSLAHMPSTHLLIQILSKASYTKLLQNKSLKQLPYPAIWNLGVVADMRSMATHHSQYPKNLLIPSKADLNRVIQQGLVSRQLLKMH